MKHSVPLLLAIPLLFLAACSGSQNNEIARLQKDISNLKSVAGPPPSVLDTLYPPESHVPVFLMRMYAMATPFTGIAVDASEGDMQNAHANFQQFSKAYDEASRLVPEWTDMYPKQPVEALGAALEAGDPNGLMEAMNGVGAICHSCHLDHMASVQQRYDWPAFSDLIMTDPVTGEEGPWAYFMRSVEFSFTGIQVDLQQGQIDAARGHFRDFNKKFQELREGCEFCHSTERTYFVDAKIQGMVDELGSALDSDSPDPQRIGGLMQGIGMESCGKCHLVHVPASYAKARWMAEASEGPK